MVSRVRAGPVCAGAGRRRRRRADLVNVRRLEQRLLALPARVDELQRKLLRRRLGCGSRCLQAVVCGRRGPDFGRGVRARVRRRGGHRCESSPAFLRTSDAPSLLAMSEDFVRRNLQMLVKRACHSGNVSQLHYVMQYADGYAIVAGAVFPDVSEGNRRRSDPPRHASAALRRIRPAPPRDLLLVPHSRPPRGTVRCTRRARRREWTR